MLLLAVGFHVDMKFIEEIVEPGCDAYWEEERILDRQH